MEFALNYSTAAKALLRRGHIAVDKFKCPPWPDLLASARAAQQVYCHFPLRTGNLESADWERIKELADLTDTPFINVHLSDSGAPKGLRANDVQSWLNDEVSKLCSIFGAPKVIVENLIYRPGAGISEAAVRPETLGYVLESSGCGFLLDLSHARISAHHLGVEARELINAYPVMQLRELHITGIARVNACLEDHMALTPEDWQETRWALEQIRKGSWRRPELVGLEYGGVGPVFDWRCDPAAIAEQAPRLYDAVKAASAAPVL